MNTSNPAVELADLTWPEVGDLAPTRSLLAVPVGSTEQHGPHLPLSTDTDIAVALCRCLAETRSDVLIAPAVAYGSSGEHAGFAGTLSIGQAATELLLVELGRSATDTFGQVLFVSAHGGNAEPVGRAVHRLRAESRDVRAFMPRWAGDPHAGAAETAIMLAVRPAAVHPERAVRGDTRPLSVLLPTLRANGVRAVSETGILGDPTGATADAGRTLLTALSADLIGEVEVWRSVATS
jgi:creatinine amidohydrolase